MASPGLSTALRRSAQCPGVVIQQGYPTLRGLGCDGQALAAEDDVCVGAAGPDAPMARTHRRRVPPQQTGDPSPHLVSFVLIDPSDANTLLVNHIVAQRWVPPGGHVEPDEHPADAATREAQEELGVIPVFADPTRRPTFVSIVDTAGIDHDHTDVSLWFLFVGQRGMPLVTDPAEFTEARWLTPQQVHAANRATIETHYPRFITKVAH
ncbi:NUDIX domain-containing protein [Kribbella sp. NPDC049227]|uniref:NUDIX domain-containing protein n=1 Tax=Kribbella sp. NPDC049227 TaxID=3364113 RepID=UPI0037181AC7